LVETVSEFFIVFQSLLKDFPNPVLENAVIGSSGLIGQVERRLSNEQTFDGLCRKCT
jgi:hypothetical protein